MSDQAIKVRGNRNTNNFRDGLVPIVTSTPEATIFLISSKITINLKNVYLPVFQEGSRISVDISRTRDEQLQIGIVPFVFHFEKK